MNKQEFVDKGEIGKVYMKQTQESTFLTFGMNLSILKRE
jgi:hypothetical protein